MVNKRYIGSLQWELKIISGLQRATERGDETTEVEALLRECKLGTHKGDLVVYRRAGEIVGCAACAGEEGRYDWWLNCIAVKKKWRNQGIGTLMINYWCDQIPDGSSLWLETYFCHRSLYERVGFTWIPASKRSEFFHDDPRTHKNTILMARFMHPFPSVILPQTSSEVCEQRA